MSTLPKVAVVGSVNVDLTATLARLPTPGETIGGGRLRRSAGGKGANQAAAASRLGAPARMIGAVGTDSDGDLVLRALSEAGVGVDKVARVDAPTGTALIAVDRHGENQIAVCPGANSRVSVDNVSFAADETVLTQLEIDLPVVLRLAEAVPGYLAVNASPARDLPPVLVERADLFLVNQSEYELMPELRKAKLVAVTEGGHGAALVARGTEIARVPAKRVVPVDTVGAGDAFCAALALALRSGMREHDALRTACAVGAAAVVHPGAQPPFRHLTSYSAQTETPESTVS